MKMNNHTLDFQVFSSIVRLIKHFKSKKKETKEPEKPVRNKDKYLSDEEDVKPEKTKESEIPVRNNDKYLSDDEEVKPEKITSIKPEKKKRTVTSFLYNILVTFLSSFFYF